MSSADAVATGQLAEVCTRGLGRVVKGHPQAAVCLTKEGGLMAIFADATMATPEGIHLGSTLAEVKAAYPSLKKSVDFFYVPINATSRYEFLITVDSKTVYEWNLNTTSQTCFN
ncbi:hypothetical protein [Nocardioides sp.]|uniref:hypothetical protein n=1 Tax=Nocardioides sp. TaxID=35761 RepID=UPI0035278188